MWLHFPVKNLSHSERTWLCDYAFQSKNYPILRGPDYVILISSQKSNPFWGELTLWLYFPVKNLSHSEGNWLCDYTFQPKLYPILRGPDYVIIISSKNSIPFWGDLTMWLYFPVKILSHSEGNWLCDYTFQPKFYPILSGPDYVIMFSSQKSIPFWGDLTMWLYFPVKSYPILRWSDYVIIISSQTSIPFWGDLTMWLYFPVKIYPIPRGPNYVIILSSQKPIPFWGDLTMWS